MQKRFESREPRGEVFKIVLGLGKDSMFQMLSNFEEFVAGGVFVKDDCSGLAEAPAD